MTIKKINIAEWHKTLITIIIASAITIGFSALQHSYGEGQLEARVVFLEKSVLELKSTDQTASLKLDQYLDKIHNLELIVGELKSSNNRQEEILLELKKAILGK